jgi:UDP-N-acetylmuramate dehydrogenase
VTLDIRSNVSLKPYNTFAVDAYARHFTDVHGEQELREAVRYAEGRSLPLQLIGGGSNLLLTGDIEGLVVRMCSRGIRTLADDGERVIVEAEAGEPWHPFVLQTLSMGLSGLENLSLIPGTVGAAPVQNIGAYGVEVGEVLAGLTALDRQTGALHELSPQGCRFAYRDSLFKQQPGRWVILRVRFALCRTVRPNLGYGPVRQRLVESGIAQPSATDVSHVICAIRREKLPDPAYLANAGSFFKNPVVSEDKAARLKERFPELVVYPQPDGGAKLAAGWLIERAGWKGYRQGDAGVHALQALVLVNHGKATGLQLLELAQRIQADVRSRFGVFLEIEPNVL